MENLTPEEHFKKNYLVTTLVMIGLFTISLILSLIRNDDHWYLSFIFLLIALILPIGSYLDWKNKQKKL